MLQTQRCGTLYAPDLNEHLDLNYL
eukprot:SAG11_NODE_12951_length_677_cov_1.160900_2_plen_24_part_01